MTVTHTLDIIKILMGFTLYYAPAFIANAAPTLVRGRHRVDFGKKFIDGNDILGGGKTFEGLLCGLILGGTIGLFISFMLNHIPNLPVTLPVFNTVIPLASALGALLGDIGGAFIKRRLGMPRGFPAPILDQLDFILGATLLIKVVGFNPEVEIVVFSMILALILHPITNKVAYLLKLKDEPW